MARSTFSVEAIIARSIDVGEADRFCILFTKERGKIAARAPGARKIGSRIGGSIQPLRRVQIDLSERGDNRIVTSARLLEDPFAARTSLAAFAQMEEGMEILAALTEDDHPLPEIYELSAQFLAVCASMDDALPAYRLRLLHLLGLLPAHDNEPQFAALSDGGQSLVRRAASARWLPDIIGDCADIGEIDAFGSRVIAGHVSRPLRSPAIAASLQGI